MTAVTSTGDRQFGRRRGVQRRRPRLALVVLLLGALYCLTPVAWVVLASSKTSRELFTTFSFTRTRL